MRRPSLVSVLLVCCLAVVGLGVGSTVVAEPTVGTLGTAGPPTGVPAGDLADTGGSPPAAHDPPANATAGNGSAGPGASLASALAGERATLDGQLLADSYRIRLDRAGTPAETATVLDAIRSDLRTRLREVRERRRGLDDAGVDHSGRLATRRATLGADAAALADIAASSRSVARSLDAGVLPGGLLDAFDGLVADANDLAVRLDGSATTPPPGNVPNVSDYDGVVADLLDPTGGIPTPDPPETDPLLPTVSVPTAPVSDPADETTTEALLTETSPTEPALTAPNLTTATPADTNLTTLFP